MGSIVRRGELEAIVCFTGGRTFGRAAEMVNRPPASSRAASSASCSRTCSCSSRCRSCCARSSTSSSSSPADGLRRAVDDHRDPHRVHPHRHASRSTIVMAAAAGTSREEGDPGAPVRHRRTGGHGRLVFGQDWDINAEQARALRSGRRRRVGSRRTSWSFLAALAAKRMSEGADAIDTVVTNAVSNDDKQRFDDYDELDFEPFDPVTKRTVAAKGPNGKEVRIAKGATKVILDMCRDKDKVRAQVLRANQDLADRGFRSIGAAATWAAPSSPACWRSSTRRATTRGTRWRRRGPWACASRWSPGTRRPSPSHVEGHRPRGEAGHPGHEGVPEGGGPVRGRGDEHVRARRRLRGVHPNTNTGRGARSRARGTRWA